MIRRKSVRVRFQLKSGKYVYFKAVRTSVKKKKR